MNNSPRQTLSRIIAEHGTGICEEPKRIEALLRDLCGAHRREINIILGALEERVAADLMAKGKSVPRDVLLARLAARLQENLAYTTEAARWGVGTWALALGIISEAELHERALSDGAETVRNSAPPPPSKSNPSTTIASGRSVKQPTPPPNRGASTPLTSPPIPPQSTKTPPAAPISPPAISARNTAVTLPNAGAVLIQQSPVQTASPALSSQQTSKRRLSLRSCLIMVVLIITLIVGAIFVVPAVILLLQEEQSQPSINEPRIK